MPEVFRVKKLAKDDKETVSGELKVSFNDVGGTLTELTKEGDDGEKMVTFQLVVGTAVSAETSEIIDNAKGGAYVIPVAKNVVDYDALCKNVAFQMTVSAKHPFNNSRVKNLLKEVGRKKLWFVYMVSAAVYDEFKYQHPLRAKKKPLAASTAEKSDVTITQLVVCVDNAKLISWHKKPMDQKD
jgi:hypothetical protein